MLDEQSKPLFLDLFSVATNNITDNPNGMIDVARSPLLRSTMNPPPTSSYTPHSDSKSSPATNQTSTCDVNRAHAKASSEAGECEEQDVDSISDNSLDDFGCDDDESDEKPPAKIRRK